MQLTERWYHVGLVWNSTVILTPENIHQIWYLPQINLSPTQQSCNHE